MQMDLRDADKVCINHRATKVQVKDHFVEN